jgi:ligand-binding sensor domain-containing protein
MVLALVATAPLAAQQYDLRTFSLEHGLPSAGVNDLCEDAEGFLWAATEQGAARGQGLRFEAWGTAQGLPGDEVTALCPTADGRVWMGLRNGMLAHWQSGAITALPRGPLPKFPVRALVAVADGPLWLASKGGGVWRMNADGTEPRPVNDGLPSPMVNAMVALADGRLLAATDSGLAVLRNDRWTVLPLPAPHAKALSIFADSQGVLVGSDKGYVELGTDLRPLPVAQRFAGYQPLALPHTVVLSIIRASSGDLWLGTPAGLVHLANQRGVPTMNTITERNGLGHDVVRCLHQDRSGGIWAGTGFGGVSKFTSDAFLYFTERDGLGSRIVSTIYRTSDGPLWIGTQGGGVSRWDGYAMQTFGREHGLPSPFVTCLAEDGDGHLLAGTLMHGVHRLGNDRF